MIEHFSPTSIDLRGHKALIIKLIIDTPRQPAFLAATTKHLHKPRPAHHQIRCQLASIGSPIKGDLKYGFDRSNKDASIHLHSKKIEFIHPVSKEQISVSASTPQDPIWDACNN